MIILRKEWKDFVLRVAVIVFICLLGFAPLANALEHKAEADHIPWSGWWWPKAKGELVYGYNGRPSPAEKYDLYVTGTRPGVAFREGMKKWYDPQAIAWEGKCSGWVNASILVPGPILASCANGVFLGIGDKKGLLTACHFWDAAVLEPCNLSPEPFHRYLINYIGEQGEIIGADLDSSAAVWTYPIYAYEMKITSGDKSDYVSCMIKYASDFVDPNYKGSLANSSTYRYRLDKDTEGNYNGNGEWLAGPVSNMHPEFVWVPVGIKQDKLFIDYEKVSEMVRTVDDELEGRPDLVTGHHLLMIYPDDDDTFSITPRVGEKIACYLALDPQSPLKNGARFRVYRNHELIESGTLDSELQTVNLSSEVGTDEFKLSILPEEDNLSGVCVHLYVDVQAQYQSYFYGFPSSQSWIGCAATSLSADDGARVWLEIDGNQGLPLGLGQSSGSSLDEGGQWLTILDNNLTEDYFNNGTPTGFRLISSFPLQGLLLAGDSHTLRGPPQSYEVVGSRLVIPWLTNAYGMTKFATLYLANQNESSVNVKISYYNNDGSPQKIADVELASETTATYTRGNYPGGIGGIDGWGIVESSEDEFSGGVTLKEGYNRIDQLPLLKSAQHWIAPHLVTSSGWQTILGVCNINPEILTLTMTAFVDGSPVGTPFLLPVGSKAKREIIIEGELFGISPELMDQAWLSIDGDRESAIYISYHYLETAGASIPLYEASANKNQHKLSHLALTGGWWTGIVLLNNSTTAVNLELVALNNKGQELQRLPLSLGPDDKFSTSVVAVFKQVKVEDLAQLKLEGEGAPAIKALAFYGGIDGVSLLAVHSW